MPADPPDLDAPAILAILDQHHVDYVVVGGYAAQLHGSTRATTDIDLTPDRSPANLARLAKALQELGGGIRVDDLAEGLPFDTSAEALAGMRTLNLRTPHGDIDLTFEPDGTHGYPDLIRNADDHNIGTLHIHIAALADIIRSKTAAGRPKDLRALPELIQIQQTLDANPPEAP
ncbi:MAG: nucleotidyl transferase AbiEii/AbiGii toxin family protein [Acidimicrobiales bacterium]